MTDERHAEHQVAGQTAGQTAGQIKVQAHDHGNACGCDHEHHHHHHGLGLPAVPARSLKVGRNDPCPCGSGQKFKKCCIDKVRG